MKLYLYMYGKKLLVINKKILYEHLGYNYEGTRRVMPPLKYLTQRKLHRLYV